MRHRVVEFQNHAELVREAFARGAEKFLERLVATRQHHELHPERHHLVERVAQQVAALLRGKPRDHPDKRAIVPSRQFERVAQVARAYALAVGHRRRILRGDQIVVRGVPFAIVRTVQDSHKALALVPQHAFEAKTEIRIGGDFARVARADGRDTIGEDDCALHQIHAAEEFEPVDSEVRGIDSEQRKFRGVVDSLEGKIVNRKGGRGARKTFAYRRVGARNDRRDRGMPVMRMQNVGPDNFGGRHRSGFSEEGEAAQIVGKVAFLVAVYSVAREELRMVDHKDRHAVGILGAQHAEPMRLSAEMRRHRGADRLRLELRGD